MNTQVTEFIAKAKHWKNELQTLRTILLSCQLTEGYKWRVPCYTYNNKNIVLIHGFKEYCAVAFFKGALLLDEKKVLIQQTENSLSARQLRFTSTNEILENEKIIKSYVFEAIEIENLGLKIVTQPLNENLITEEFTLKIKQQPEFKKAFFALTPGRQKAYHLFFSGATQAKTRQTRIEKYTQQIINGKGFYDCTCGLSKKMPSCDGSHKMLKR